MILRIIHQHPNYSLIKYHSIINIEIEIEIENDSQMIVFDRKKVQYY